MLSKWCMKMLLYKNKRLWVVVLWYEHSWKNHASPILFFTFDLSKSFIPSVRKFGRSDFLKVNSFYYLIVFFLIFKNYFTQSRSSVIRIVKCNHYCIMYVAFILSHKLEIRIPCSLQILFFVKKKLNKKKQNYPLNVNIKC